jgi:hypothetical protein
MSRHSKSRTAQAVVPLSILQVVRLGIDQHMVSRLRELDPPAQQVLTAEEISFFHVERRDRDDSNRV